MARTDIVVLLALGETLRPGTPVADWPAARGRCHQATRVSTTLVAC